MIVEKNNRRDKIRKDRSRKAQEAYLYKEE